MLKNSLKDWAQTDEMMQEADTDATLGAGPVSTFSNGNA